MAIASRSDDAFVHGHGPFVLTFDVPVPSVAIVGSNIHARYGGGYFGSTFLIHKLRYTTGP